MSKKVLDVGNCHPDHFSLVSLLQSHFDVEVLRAHGMSDALDIVQQDAVTLVLVNRLMDRDGSSGLAIIEKLKAASETKSIPVMMITNFPDHQQLAIAAGAEPGFGKADLRSPETLDKLRTHLS